MAKARIGIVAIIAVALLHVVAFAGAAQLNKAELESFMDSVIQRHMDEVGIAGATLAVVSSGEVILTKGYGYADRDNQIAVDPNQTLFRVGSVSKLFVWTAVMQLVEQGKLDLHANVNTYLDFEMPNTLLGSRATAEPITLAHLMAHTAGFEDVSASLFFLEDGRMPPLEEYVRTHVPARVFPPGEVAAYSNYGSALAGYIVQRVSGMPFAQYVEQNIFNPLRMETTTFRQPVPAALAPHVARGYRWTDSDVIEGVFVYALEPAGGMSTTAADMARFMLAHLQGGAVDGQRILAEATVNRMHTRLSSQHPALDGSAHGFIEQTINGQRAVMHLGSILLFNSGVYLLPELDTGIFVSFSGGSHLQPIGLFQEFMNHYYPTPVAAIPGPTASGNTKAIVGEYHVNRRGVTSEDAVLTLLDTLQVAVDEAGYLQVTHLGQTDTFVEVGPGMYRNVAPGTASDPYGMFNTLIFATGTNGQMILHSDGPMSYTKAPWYATSQFTLAAVLIPMLIGLGTLIVWAIRGAIGRIRRRAAKRTGADRWARVFAVAYILMTVVFIFGALASSGEMDPAFGLPKAYFGDEPAWAPMLKVLPILLWAFGGALVIFTALAWVKRSGRMGGRIHYTVLSVAAITLLMALSIWNLV